jgi:triosephosphate isomerase
MNRRRILLGTSWKMNKTAREGEAYAERLSEFLEGSSGLEHIQIFVIPPFTAIEAVKRASGGRFWVGAQNMHAEEWGAFTGEISAPMLQELGVDLVELGHAERRQYFNETDENVRRKVRMASRHGLRALVCVGERLKDREFGIEKEIITCQLRVALSGIAAEHASLLLVAYEPVWAIGEGATAASVNDIRTMNEHIRGLLKEMFGPSAPSVPVLYGGTVDVDDCAELLIEGRSDGLFIGRAAWNAKDFARLIACCAAAFNRGHSEEIPEKLAHSS